MVNKIKATKDRDWLIWDFPYFAIRYWKRFKYYGFSGHNRFSFWRFEFIWYGY